MVNFWKFGLQGHPKLNLHLGPKDPKGLLARAERADAQFPRICQVHHQTSTWRKRYESEVKTVWSGLGDAEFVWLNSRDCSIHFWCYSILFLFCQCSVNVFSKLSHAFRCFQCFRKGCIMFKQPSVWKWSRIAPWRHHVFTFSGRNPKVENGKYMETL